MGCIWSGEDANRCAHCNRRPRNNLVFIGNVCEICIAQASRTPSSIQLKPSFGEYRCACGRYWTSRLSWARSYQICKRCQKRVYAYSQRPLLPSDMTHGKDNQQEHQRAYCQMCQQLGFYCGNYGNKAKGRKKHYSR